MARNPKSIKRHSRGVGTQASLDQSQQRHLRVAAASKQAVEELIATDPSTLVGRREKVGIVRWSKAFGERRARI